MNLTNLPDDLFRYILRLLPPRASILCRAVCTTWHAAFTRPDTALQLLKWDFPRSREMRLLGAAAHTARPGRGADVDYAAVFATVARRYHHLEAARPRAVEKIAVAPTGTGTGPGPTTPWFRGVARWDSFLRLEDRTAPFYHPDPLWTYGRDEGVLVYAVPGDADGGGDDGGAPPRRPFRARDLATGAEVVVPFDVAGKIVRRIRLAAGILVVEWCEREPFHELTAEEVVHRHFVTAYDVRPAWGDDEDGPSSSSSSRPPLAEPPAWSVTFRSEWKNHFLGLPLNRHDRFLSVHDARHYAMYLWQPNRGAWGDDFPIEALLVWDIGRPSRYRPSEDPTGQRWRRRRRRRGGSSSGRRGPAVIRRFTWGELGFLDVRQRFTPRLRGLALDAANVYLHEEEHRWLNGLHSSLTPPRTHRVRSTGVPILPCGGEDEVEEDHDEAGGAGWEDGDEGQQAGEANEEEEVDGYGREDGKGHEAAMEDGEEDGEEDEEAAPVLGPRWVDECRNDGDKNMSFCPRAHGGLVAAAAAAQQRADQPWPSLPRAPSPGSSLADRATPAPNLSPRWPGHAPCWRHEEFPFLTVSESVDVGAGVRFAARHCILLDTLSVHVWPQLRVQSRGRRSRPGDVYGYGYGYGYGYVEDEDEDEDEEQRRQWYGDDGGVGLRGDEAQFTDDMWAELMGKGYICGDERWLIGEDGEGRVTILRF